MILLFDRDCGKSRLAGLFEILLGPTAILTTPTTEEPAEGLITDICPAFNFMSNSKTKAKEKQGRVVAFSLE